MFASPSPFFTSEREQLLPRYYDEGHDDEEYQEAQTASKLAGGKNMKEKVRINAGDGHPDAGTIVFYVCVAFLPFLIWAVVGLNRHRSRVRQTEATPEFKSSNNLELDDAPLEATPEFKSSNNLELDDAPLEATKRRLKEEYHKFVTREENQETNDTNFTGTITKVRKIDDNKFTAVFTKFNPNPKEAAVTKNVELTPLPDDKGCYVKFVGYVSTGFTRSILWASLESDRKFQGVKIRMGNTITVEFIFPTNDHETIVKRTFLKTDTLNDDLYVFAGGKLAEFGLIPNDHKHYILIKDVQNEKIRYVKINH